jgi:predicted Rossmann fold nucleotide-binding protein DprA/Smf involved in DNA uptake
VEDFLEVTRMQRGERGPSQRARAAGGEQLELAGTANVDGPGSRVLKALGKGPKSVDRLVALSGLSVREVSAALGEMEIRGAVSRAGPGMFMRVP